MTYSFLKMSKISLNKNCACLIFYKHICHILNYFYIFFCMFNSVQCPSPDFSSTICHPWTCLLHSSITYESFKRNFFKIVVYFLSLYTGITLTFEEQLDRMWKSCVLALPSMPRNIVASCFGVWFLKGVLGHLVYCFYCVWSILYA